MLWDEAQMDFPSNKQPVSSRKRRGGYYTPIELAQYLVKWGLRDGTERILEPSCGDGNFIIALLRYLRSQDETWSPTVVAVEIDQQELAKAKRRLKEPSRGFEELEVEWIRDDFFEAYGHLKRNDRFDLILGNPPFIRFQYFDNGSREKAFGHLREAGYKPTKLANAWAAFVQLSIELLADGGRLAMVVPAELLQVTYASELRSRLAAQFQQIVIVGFERLVFPEIQQEVFLLLAEGKQQSTGELSDIHTIEFLNGRELLRSGDLDDSIAHIPAKHSRPGMKWTSLFLDEPAFAALDEAERAAGLTPLGQLADVDVGVVTGRNSFFILSQTQRNELEVVDLTTPVVGRTSALKGVLFSKETFDEYSVSYPSFMLDLTGVDFHGFPPRLKDYLALGEQAKIHLGYKCRIRKRWFDVPSIHVPDAFLFRQIYHYPLLVLNSARVTSTDTIHRVRIKGGVNSKLLAAAFFNSLTLAWSEVCGRSYGGGVLELEPREAEQLPIPYDSDLEIDLEKVDALLSQGRAHEALDYVDSIVLKEHIGFDSFLIRKVRNAWEELRDRRKRRR